MFSFVREKLIKIFSLFSKRRDLCQEKPTALSSPPNDLAQIFCQNISDDALIDVLKFLELNEVEKSQQVSRRWNRTISNATPHLQPQRRIYRLIIENHWPLEVPNQICKKKDCFFKSSKNCINLKKSQNFLLAQIIDTNFGIQRSQMHECIRRRLRKFSTIHLRLHFVSCWTFVLDQRQW